MLNYMSISYLPASLLILTEQTWRSQRLRSPPTLFAESKYTHQEISIQFFFFFFFDLVCRQDKELFRFMPIWFPIYRGMQLINQWAKKRAGYTWYGDKIYSLWILSQSSQFKVDYKKKNQHLKHSSSHSLVETWPHASTGRAPRKSPSSWNVRVCICLCS